MIFIGIGIVLLLWSSSLTKKYMKQNSGLLYDIMNNDQFDDGVKNIAKNQMLENNTVPKWVSIINLIGWGVLVIGILDIVGIF